MHDTIPKTLHEKLCDYVEDAHALEKSVVKNLDSMSGTLDDPALDGMLKRHRQMSRQHVQRLELRLEELGRGTSMRKQIEGMAAELMKSVSDVLRTDVPGKVGRDVYLIAHTQIAAYELLRRLAEHAGDAETVDLARSHLDGARSFADEIPGHWDDFLRLTVEEWGEDADEPQTTAGNGIGASPTV